MMTINKFLHNGKEYTALVKHISNPNSVGDWYLIYQACENGVICELVAEHEYKEYRKFSTFFKQEESTPIRYDAEFFQQLKGTTQQDKLISFARILCEYYEFKIVNNEDEIKFD